MKSVICLLVLYTINTTAFSASKPSLRSLNAKPSIINQFSSTHHKEPRTATSTTSLRSNSELISTAFDVATFLPQPFWLLMIFLPNLSLTKSVMGNWSTIIGFSLVHLFIVITSVLQPDGAGTAPIAEVIIIVSLPFYYCCSNSILI